MELEAIDLSRAAKILCGEDDVYGKMSENAQLNCIKRSKALNQEQA